MVEKILGKPREFIEVKDIDVVLLDIGKFWPFFSTDYFNAYYGLATC
jgi:hypothetical protein